MQSFHLDETPPTTPVVDLTGVDDDDVDDGPSPHSTILIHDTDEDDDVQFVNEVRDSEMGDITAWNVSLTTTARQAYHALSRAEGDAFTHVTPPLTDARAARVMKRCAEVMGAIGSIRVVTGGGLLMRNVVEMRMAVGELVRVNLPSLLRVLPRIIQEEFLGHASQLRSTIELSDDENQHRDEEPWRKARRHRPTRAGKRRGGVGGERKGRGGAVEKRRRQANKPRITPATGASDVSKRVWFSGYGGQDSRPSQVAPSHSHPEEAGNARNRTQHKTMRKPQRDDVLGQPLQNDNVGFRILSKMGWKQGMALGASGDGRMQPVQIRFRRRRAGIGHQLKADDHPCPKAGQTHN